jgi:hypothetical protein
MLEDKPHSTKITVDAYTKDGSAQLGISTASV